MPRELQATGVCGDSPSTTGRPGSLPAPPCAPSGLSSPTPHTTCPSTGQEGGDSPWEMLLEVMDVSPRVTHILCTPQSHSSIQTYLCESWEQEGVGNEAIQASHTSPEAAGSPLLVNPSDKPTLYPQLCTHLLSTHTQLHLVPALPWGPCACFLTHLPPDTAEPESSPASGWQQERNVECLRSQHRAPWNPGCS